jgi:UMF1 family MFS transporter
MSKQEQGQTPKRATVHAKDHGVADAREIRAWYVFDWANSPFYQVLDTVFKVVIKRIATFAEAKGVYWTVMTPGAYPAFVSWATAGIQMICLLTFAVCGDYGDRKKVLMQRLTYVGSAVVLCMGFCFDGVLWPLAGILRVVAGSAFIVSVVFYNAFLPLLASSHPEIQALEGEARADKKAKVTDELSAKGQLIGYSGGMCMVLVAFIIQVLFACDRETDECTEFQQLFFLSISTALVGVWWSGFSLYTFKYLKAREGPPYPEGVNIFKLGWTQAAESTLMMCRLRDLGCTIFAFFLFSDALNTILQLAVLVLDDQEGSDVSLVFNIALAALGGIVGTALWALLQWACGLSTRPLLIIQLTLLMVISGACAMGALDSTLGFYACLAPVMLTMGSMQAMSRSLFSQMIPVGTEANMFALYMILDKGSTLIGSFVTGMVHTTTGTYDPAFWYCMVAFLFGIVLLYLVDVERGQISAGRRQAGKDPDQLPPSELGSPTAKKDEDARRGKSEETEAPLGSENVGVVLPVGEES